MHDGFSNTVGFGLPAIGFSLFFLVIVWSLIWKGLALWHAAQRKDVWWFIAFLVINTAGILEIIYLFGVCKYTFAQLTGSHAHRHEHKE
jgi:hypothetical protein